MIAQLSSATAKETQAQIDLDKIHIDQGILSRVQLDQETARIYSQDLAAGVLYEDIDLFFDGEKFWLADGLHRVTAAKLAQKKDINAKVHLGSRRDALLFALTHKRYGLARSHKDKRKAVVLMLADPEWSLWANTRIAQQCSVAETLVRNVKTALLELGSIDAKEVFALDLGLTPNIITEALQNLKKVNESGFCQIIRKGKTVQFPNSKPSLRGSKQNRPTERQKLVEVSIDPNIPPLVFGQIANEEKSTGNRAQILEVKPQTKFPQKVIVSSQRCWRLGQNHMIYCGLPNDKNYLDLLPTGISLALAFPRTEHQGIDYFPIQTPARFSFSCEPHLLEIESFRNGIEYLLDATTQSGDLVMMAFIPEELDAWIFQILFNMGNPCYCVEPDPEVCARAIGKWNAYASEHSLTPATEITF